jgi:hypothetical protein
MKRNWSSVTAFWLVVVVTIGMIGCGDDKKNSSIAPDSAPIDVTGAWDLSVMGYNVILMTLNQDGENVTGTTDPITETSSPGIVTGTNIQNNLILTITYENAIPEMVPGLGNNRALVFYLLGMASPENGMNGTFDSSPGVQGGWSATKHSASGYLR